MCPASGVFRTLLSKFEKHKPDAKPEGLNEVFNSDAVAKGESGSEDCGKCGK